MRAQERDIMSTNYYAVTQDTSEGGEGLREREEVA